MSVTSMPFNNTRFNRQFGEGGGERTNTRPGEIGISNVRSSFTVTLPPPPMTTESARIAVTRIVEALGGVPPASKAIRPRIVDGLVTMSCRSVTSLPSIRSACAACSWPPIRFARMVYSPGVKPLMVNLPSGLVCAPRKPPPPNPWMALTPTPLIGRPCASTTMPDTRAV
jgi:hypothetical protein